MGWEPSQHPPLWWNISGPHFDLRSSINEIASGVHNTSSGFLSICIKQNEGPQATPRFYRYCRLEESQFVFGIGDEHVFGLTVMI